MVRHLAPNPLEMARRRHQRRHGDGAMVMVGDQVDVDGRVLRYAVSDNDAGGSQIWAVNLHGYFSGGAMYWRESALLAERFGWRVVNPSLPGFGGSDPLPWGEISMASLARVVERLLDHLGAGPVVVLGHSMGGAVAVEFASRRPERTLGIIYRDGVATPAWKDRRGLIPSLLSPVLPDIAPVADIIAAIVLDVPDLFVGRILSTVTSMLPDVRANMRTLATTAPIGSMLLTVDLRNEVRQLRAVGLPVLAEWGCFDRVATARAAEEFAALAGTKVQWLPGGHSWMLARPQGQSDVLAHLPSGSAFVRQVEARRARLDAARRELPLAN
ncbi:MAG TPA: alpha/beta fold hydrolase [Acidimicrobiales bacterium]|nr:alpha/beta fold hydrolase [Acidimicrobiales bacterium]